MADVELGTMTYSFRSEMDSQPAVLYMIFQTAGSNATAVNKEITAQMERMEKNLPEGTEFVTMMLSLIHIFSRLCRSFGSRHKLPVAAQTEGESQRKEGDIPARFHQFPQGDKVTVREYPFIAKG